MVFTEDQGHVGYGVDEAGVLDLALFNQGGPELAGNLELLVNTQCLGRVYGAVGTCRGVVEFAER